MGLEGRELGAGQDAVGGDADDGGVEELGAKEGAIAVGCC